jgi:hypothetical protein
MRAGARSRSVAGLDVSMQQAANRISASGNVFDTIFPEMTQAVAAPTTHAMHTATSNLARKVEVTSTPTVPVANRKQRRSLATIALDARNDLSINPFAVPVSPPSSEPSPDVDPATKPSRWQQLKSTLYDYGPVFAGYYAATWTIGYAACFGALTVTGFDGVDLLTTIFEQTGVDSIIDIGTWSPWMINGALATEMNEYIEPFRMPFVLSTTPQLAKMLKT